MTETLEQVIADERADAAVLARNGHRHDAELLERVLARVEKAARYYLLWLHENEAESWSGRSARWLRAEFHTLAALGLAEWRQGRRYFRACALPRRAEFADARQAGRLAGLELAA